MSHEQEHVQELKGQIQAALGENQPTAILEQVAALLNPSSHLISEELEERLGKAMENIESGNFMTLAEFHARSDEQDTKRNAQYGK